MKMKRKFNRKHGDKPREFKAFEPVFVKMYGLQVVTWKHHQQRWKYLVQGKNGEKNRPKTRQPDKTKTDRKDFERTDKDFRLIRRETKNIGRIKETVETAEFESE